MQFLPFAFCLLPFYFCLFTFAFFLSPPSATAQSSDQNFPTHVTTNEINGVIKARAMGDARLTTYFYLFEGSQGDIFINVVTKNFSGDIDVFAADDMRPLTKMVMYADTGTSETGRLIYLRQSSRMLLRIEGRTPNDDAAEFRIKFAGSFVALAPDKYAPPPTVAKRESVESRKSVDSKKSEKVSEAPVAEDQTPKSEPPASAGGEVVDGQKPPTEDKKTDDPDTVYENESAKVTVKPVTPPPAKKKTVTAKSAKSKSVARKPKAQRPKPETTNPKPETPPPPDPLANIKLVVELKDGSIVERPMTEVMRFTFDRGTLTVIEKGGKITRYKITDIAKVTVE